MIKIPSEPLISPTKTLAGKILNLFESEFNILSNPSFSFLSSLILLIF